jgi:hypothetical protein
MNVLFHMIKAIILAPFRIIKFIVSDVIVFGIIGGIFSLVRGLVKMIFKPLSLLLLIGGAVAFTCASEDQKKKIRALVGM